MRNFASRSGGWSRRGKVLMTLLTGVLCIEGAVALQAGYPINPCKSEGGGFATADGGCKDVSSGRVWSRNTLSAERGGTMWRFVGAGDYCRNLVEGGYADWRLPTRVELKTVAANGGGTYLDSFSHVRGDTGEITEQDMMKWSSTTIKGGKYAYVVAQGSGREAVDGWATKAGASSWTDVACVR